LTHRADEALYHVKRGGRDGVRVSYQHTPELLPSAALLQSV